MASARTARRLLWGAFGFVLLSCSSIGPDLDLDLGNCAGTFESCSSAACCRGLACVPAGSDNLCMSSGVEDDTDGGGGWRSFSETHRWGDCAADDAGTCVNALTFYEHRIVRPDGSLSIHGTNESRTGALDADDRALLFGIIESEAFVTGMQDGFDCPGADASDTYEFSIGLGDNTYQNVQPVTGCALGGTGDVRVVHDLLQRY